MKIELTKFNPLYLILMRIIQHLYLILLFPIFVLAVNPAGLAEVLPPGVSYYIYILWPKLSVLSGLFVTGVLGSIVSFVFNRIEVIHTLKKYKFILFTLLLFLALYSFANLYQSKNYLTSYEVWYGQIIHGDGLIFTFMWWMLIPLGIIVFRDCFVKPSFVEFIIILSFSISLIWALCNKFGVEPARMINPNILNTGINAGFGNRSWAGFIFSLFFVAFFFKNLRYSFSWKWFILVGLATMSIVMTGGRMGLINIALALIGGGIFLRLQKLSMRHIITPFFAIIFFTIISYGAGLGSSSRLTGLAQFQTDGGFTHRIIPWKAGIREILKSPFLGNHSQSTGRIVWANLTDAETKELLTEFATRDEIFGGRYKFSEGTLTIFNDQKKEANVSSVAFSRFHNQYIELGVRGGILLIVIYVILLIYLIFALVRRKDDLSFGIALIAICYAIYSMVWFTGPVVESFTFAIIGLGLACRKSYTNDK